MGKPIKPLAVRQYPYPPPRTPGASVKSAATSDKLMSADSICRDYSLRTPLSAYESIFVTPENNSVSSDVGEFLLCHEDFSSFSENSTTSQESINESIGENEDPTK